MPAFTIFKNEKCLGTVSPDNLEVFNIRLHGDRVTKTFSWLDAYGGARSPDNDTNHLTWLHSIEVDKGDSIKVHFDSQGANTLTPHTFSELFGDTEPESIPYNSADEMYDALRARSKLRDGYRFQMHQPDTERATYATRSEDFGYALSLLWYFKKPEQAKVMLTSTTIDEVQRQENGATHTQFYLALSQYLEVRVDA